MDIWGPKLHEGFYDAFKSLEKLGLQAAIKEMLTKYPNSDILVTGHSLGGALAAISALELKQNPVYNEYAIKSVNVITFGQPRWCNKNLALFFDDIIDSNWRIVNKHDSVPTLPYEAMGYYHTSIEIWYTSTDPLTYQQCDGSGEDWGCVYVGYSIDDHLNYFGLYEDCPNDGDSVGNNTTNMMDISSTMMADIESTDVISVDEDDKLFESTAMDEGDDLETVVKSLDIVYVVVLCVVLAMGWVLAIIFGCCCCKFRKQLLEFQRRSSYFQMGDDDV